MSLELGYALSAEEHAPLALVEHARRAEESGFAFALISDHFHPWVDEQGESPFVWSVLGGIALGDEKVADRDGGDVPADSNPSGDRRAGGCDGGSDASWPVLPRRWHR